MAQVGFEPRPCSLQSRRSNHSTTLPTFLCRLFLTPNVFSADKSEMRALTEQKVSRKRQTKYRVKVSFKCYRNQQGKQKQENTIICT